jgi:ketosteroid isomerase-like protein
VSIDVEAELEIRNLIAQVQLMVDRGTVEEYLDLFTDDAVWVTPGDPATGLPADERAGKESIRTGVEERRAAGIQGPGTNTRHLSTTLAVHHDGGDTALTTSYFQYYTDTTTTPTLRAIGGYHHTAVRTPAGWKIRRREIFFD